jgi:dihydroorotase
MMTGRLPPTKMPVRPRASRSGEGAGSPAPPSVQLVLAGRAWIRGRLVPIEIGVDGSGRIAKVGRDVRGGCRRDFGDRVLIPSATDVHVHFRSAVERPGTPETVASGTLQAALGGVGLAGDMPNTDPPLTTVDRMVERRDAALGRLAVDLFAYAALERRARVPALAREAAAFKLYLSPTTGIEPPPESEPVADLLRAAAETGLPVSVHAEDPRAFGDLAVVRDAETWDAHRPLEAELDAVGRLLPPPPALRLHVAHVTATETVDRLTETGGVSFEATPHHLLLSTERVRDDPRAKVNPPIRSEAVRSGLWEAFREGRIPLLASDHAPHAMAEKARGFAGAPSGMPGVETALPLLLSRVRSADLDLGVLLRAACDRPARWVGAPQGRLAPGHRANLLVVDFRARTRIEARRLHAAVEWTAFEGWDAVFPQYHYLDGELIVDSGEYVGRPRGTFVRPEFATRPLEEDGATVPLPAEKTASP